MTRPVFVFRIIELVNRYEYHCVVIHVVMVSIYSQRGDLVKLYHAEPAWDLTTGNQLGI